MDYTAEAYQLDMARNAAEDEAKRQYDERMKQIAESYKLKMAALRKAAKVQ